MPLNFSTGQKALTTFSLASLTDIVLLLLIFFLLTSSFVTQYGIQINLPQAEAGAPDLQETLTVTITADGSFFVEEVETTEADLESTIAAVRAGRDALVLRADELATVGQFAAVAAAAKRQELRVLMATQQPLD
ncbi:biopolymer transporter ExbD [soil metagenome]